LLVHVLQCGTRGHAHIAVRGDGVWKLAQQLLLTLPLLLKV
jgi:hypothetical protein